MQRLFKQRVLSPDRVFSKVPTVVTPQDDDRIFAFSENGEFVEKSPHLSVCECDAGRIVLTNFDCEIRVSVGIAFPSVVLHEFT